MLVLVFGMTVVGCDIPEEDDYYDTPELSGILSIDNRYPVVGETITATFQAGNYYDIKHGIVSGEGIGTPSWRWYKTEEDATFLSDIVNKTAIGYNNTYTVQQSDVGFWIWAELSYSGSRGSKDANTSSTVIGIPATATVSVSIIATRGLSYDQYPNSNNHFITVTLTLSDGRWNNNVSYSTASQWLTMSGTPSVSSWYTGYQTPSISAYGRKLQIVYSTRSDTTLSISNLTATLNAAQLSTMRSSTNVYNTLTAGTSTASVSQWTISEY
jgi:hypothetical protein